MRFCLRVACVLVPLFSVISPAQVLISRRVYRQGGASHQQIWNWDPANGALMPLTHSSRDHFQPTCLPGGKIRFFTSQFEDQPRPWLFNRATGAEQFVAKKPIRPSTDAGRATAACSAAARSGDLLACANGQEVVLSRSQSQILHTHVGKHDNPPILRLSWSPSREWLLIETQGLNSNSSARQSDYYALDVLRRKVTPAGSGNSAIWVPAQTAILFTTPRELAPLSDGSQHSVWTSHVVSFEPATKKTTPITSGLSNDVDLSVCTSH